MLAKIVTEAITKINIRHKRKLMCTLHSALNTENWLNLFSSKVRMQARALHCIIRWSCSCSKRSWLIYLFIFRFDPHSCLLFWATQILYSVQSTGTNWTSRLKIVLGYLVVPVHRWADLTDTDTQERRGHQDLTLHWNATMRKLFRSKFKWIWIWVCYTLHTALCTLTLCDRTNN